MDLVSSKRLANWRTGIGVNLMVAISVERVEQRKPEIGSNLVQIIPIAKVFLVAIQGELASPKLMTSGF